MRANGCEFVSCDCVCWAQCSRAGVRQVPARGCPPVGVKYVGKEVAQTPAHSLGEHLTHRPVPSSAPPLKAIAAVTDSNLSAPRSPGPARRRHMGAQVRKCHGRAWAPWSEAAHMRFTLRGLRAHTGVPAFPGSPRAARTARGKGTARDSPGRTHAAAVPRASPTWTRRRLARPRACGPAPYAAARPALLAAARTPCGRAGRSPLAALSGRSRDAAVAAKARRRLGLGRAPHWLAPSVTRPAPPRPRPPDAHAFPGLWVDLHSVLLCAHEMGPEVHRKPAQSRSAGRPRGAS